MKKCRLFALLLVLVMVFTACGKNQTEDESQGNATTDPTESVTATTEPTSQHNTEIQGEIGGTPTESFEFTDMPEALTPEEALASGCMVLQWPEGEETPIVKGVDYWYNFLDLSSRGEKVTLRVYSFASGSFWFTDLYFSSGLYALYSRDPYSEVQSRSYKYMTHVQEQDIYTGENLDFYILTDDAELGGKEVITLNYICDIEAERNVEFFIIDFTTYFH